jgi:hypothetical protein
MRRLVTEQLEAWKESPRRKPLIVRGARQVGKTWAIAQFGRDSFDAVHIVDLERRRDWHRVFEPDLEAPRILAELELLLGRRITPGRELLFFDEIQACPRALVALRYFLEQLPDLHVVAAGSLLEFATRDLSFPVGRVQFLNLYPMTLQEFFWATGQDVAAEVVGGPPMPQAPAAHDMLLDQVRRYLFVGGMPECVHVYAETGSLRDVFEVQDELATAYREDFGKYAPRADKDCLNAVLSSVARDVGRQTKYVRLADGFKSPTIKRAFDLLTMAQVARKVRAASPAGVPLGSSASGKRFKSLLVDVGLMQRLSGLRSDIEYAKPDLLAVYDGALAEQFVGQELAAATRHDLYYWTRSERASSAEVDYLIETPV